MPYLDMRWELTWKRRNMKWAVRFVELGGMHIEDLGVCSAREMVNGGLLYLIPCPQSRSRNILDASILSLHNWVEIPFAFSGIQKPFPFSCSRDHLTEQNPHQASEQPIEFNFEQDAMTRSRNPHIVKCNTLNLEGARESAMVFYSVSSTSWSKHPFQ